MFNNVLVTLDLTAPASWKKALPQAVELVRASGGRLHVLSVIPMVESPLTAGFLPADFERKAVTQASADLNGIVTAHVPEDVSVVQHLAVGVVYSEIAAAIEATGCDLVVMASHQPDRVREFLIGSNADRVVRRSPVSVLVVRG